MGLGDLGALLAKVGAVLTGADALGKALSGKPRAETAPEQGVSRYGAQEHVVRNINDRVRLIADLIRKDSYDPETIREARELVSQKCGDKWCIAERDYSGEIRALFAATRGDTRYLRDPEDKDLYSIKFSRMTKSGDCDEGTAKLGSRLRAIGYPVWLDVWRIHGDSDWSHISLHTAYEKGGRSIKVYLDPSVDLPAGWRVPPEDVAAHKSFRVQ